LLAVTVADGLQSTIAEQLRRRVPGLSIAVVNAGHLEWAQGFGFADLSTRRPANARTIYPWFSMTKIVTATAVMHLVDGGRLRLDDAAAAYLPEHSALLRPAGQPAVTIRHLLSHSAGLANPIPLGWVHPVDMPAPDQSAFTRRLLSRQTRLQAPPGSHAAYSNLGYLALGEIIARISGFPYQQYVREHLLKPLGMSRTDFVYRNDLLCDAAVGYQARWHPMTLLLPFVIPKGILGQAIGRYIAFRRFNVDGAAYGGLIGPVEDAARFACLHLNNGLLDGTRVLSTDAIGAMQRITATGPKLEVGLGWFRERSDRAPGPRYLEHLGGGAGFWSDVRIYPNESRGVVVMGNSTSYDHRQLVSAVRQQKRPGPGDVERRWRGG
jgi:CubicO group peptidase (beta-lactamase class C family)